jgi:Glycosyl transferase family 2
VTPRLSIVVPVRDAAGPLTRCLSSIARAAESSGGGVEILVADNGSADSSAAVARACGARVIAAPGLRVSAVRNRAAFTALAPLVAFVDADHEIGPGWVAAAMAACLDAGVVAAGAEYLAPPCGTWVQRCYDTLRRREPGPSLASWLPSGNLVVRRDAFVAVGGFDERLETCEDVDLCRRLASSGRIVSDPRLASVHHGDPATLGTVFLGELWRGRDNLRVSLRPPRTTRSLLTAAQPLVTAGGAVAVVAVGGAVWHSVWAAAGALIVFVTTMSLPRMLVMASRATVSGWRGRLACVPVALAFDLGRALAIVVRAGHRVRSRSGTPEVAIP